VTAEGGRVGCLSQHSVYRLQHAQQIAINIAVPEPKNAKAGSSERIVSIFVTRAMFIQIVLTAVDLDHETVFHTHKVHNESLTRRLPSEMISALPP
jgi:hypothetical protein